MTMKPEVSEESDELELELFEPSALAIAEDADELPDPLLPLAVLLEPPLPAVTAEPTAPEIDAIVPDIDA
jgi:hypothetical protein